MDLPADSGFFERARQYTGRIARRLLAKGAIDTAGPL